MTRFLRSMLSLQ